MSVSVNPRFIKGLTTAVEVISIQLSCSGIQDLAGQKIGVCREMIDMPGARCSDIMPLLTRHAAAEAGQQVQ